MCSESLSGDLSVRMLLSEFADGLSDIVYRRRIWPDAAFEYVNGAVTQIAGYTPSELYADPNLATRIVHPDDRPQLVQWLETADGSWFDFTARLIARDGGIRHVQYRNRLIRDETGRPVAVEGIGRDVTAEVEAAAAVQRHQELLDLASDSIFTWDADSCLTSWNKGAERLYGWEVCEALGKNVHELLCTRFPAPLDEIMATILADDHWEGRLVHTTRGGAQVTVESRWTRQRQAGGTVTGYLEINHDVTERVRLEAELIERERRYRSLFDNAPDMYCLGIPTEDRITDCNQTLLQTLGYTKEELIGKSPSVLFAPESFARMLSRLPNFLDARRSDNFEAQMRRKDGALVDVLMSATLEADPAGGPPLSLATMRDITVRTRAEEEQRVLAERLKLALEVASIGVWDSVRQGQTMVWDARMCEMHGIEPQTDVTYDQWRSFIHPEDVARMTEASRASVADGKPRAVEYRVTLPDGTTRYLQGMGQTLQDADANLLRQVGVCMDITERKVREQERGFLAAIVDSSPDAIIGGSLDGTIVSWNAGAEKLYGYTAVEAIGQHFTILAHPDERQQMEHILAQITNTKKSVSREMPRLSKDGRIVEVEVTAAPVFDEQGTVIGVSSISHDISARNRMARELQESEERFRLIADILPVPEVLVRASDEVILYANPALAQLVGVAAEELTGKQETLFHIDIQQRTQIVNEIHRKGFVRNVELELRKLDGTPFWCLYSATRSAFHGEPVILAAMLDITERKNAEAALAESEARLRAIIENTGDSIWSIDRDYRMLAGNSTFDHLTEMQLGRALSAGESVFDVPYPSASIAFWKPHYDRVLAGEAMQFQVESVLRPGIVLECFLNPIRTAGGDVAGVAGRSNDITERLRRETMLRETTQRLKLAVDAARIGVWSWNYADSSLEWDDRMCELYVVGDEMRAAGLFYDVWRSRVHPDDLAYAAPAENDVSRAPREWRGSFRIVLPDNTIRYIQSASVIEHDRQGKPYRMIGINRDISEQVLYEQVLQDTNAFLEQRVRERTAELAAALEEVKAAGRLKDEFLAAISHELRTPLTGILGAVELLSMELFGPVTARQQLKLTMLQESGERLLKMVNSLLRYANLNAGRSILRREHCALDEVGMACIAKASRAAEAKHVEVFFRIPSPAPVIRSDAQGVMDLLDELLDNAVKFTPEGGHIGLEIGETDDGVRLVVWDTGITIAPEKMDTIFQPFVQGEGGLTRRYEGIGLGLAFVARMTEALGGSIMVESELGKGSRFTVCLPREYAADGKRWQCPA